MTAIYNEIDPFAARWLRNLITAGHIAPGVVDERSISDLVAADVAGVGQRHFFAGIAGWSLALRLAGVPDSADVWTGSCPCQGLSSAGKRLGFDDPRHLWPVWSGLIRECRPAVVFGEQVASALGWAWLDLVFADLEGAGYACAAADLPACSVGAPHRRQRLFFVAYADGEQGRLLAAQRQPGRADAQAEWDREARRDCACWDRQCSHRVRGISIAVGQRFADGGVADAASVERDRSWLAGNWRGESSDSRTARELADATGERRHGLPRNAGARREQSELAGRGETSSVADPEATGRGPGRIDSSHGRSTIEPRRHGDDSWTPCDWIPCSDGVSRPVEPGVSPLVVGLPGRVGLLRGFGNAFAPEVGATFIRAALEAA